MVTSFTDWDAGLHLEHHGVKGQKHGVRQYQNKDGSLTPLGRQHYGQEVQSGYRDGKLQSWNKNSTMGKKVAAEESKKAKQAATIKKKIQAEKKKEEAKQKKEAEKAANASATDSTKKKKGKKAKAKNGGNAKVAPNQINTKGSRAKGGGGSSSLSKYDASKEVEGKIKALLRGGGKKG